MIKVTVTRGSAARGFPHSKAAAAQPGRPQKTMVCPTEGRWHEQLFAAKTRCGTQGGVIGWLVMSFVLVSALLVLGGIFFVHHIKVHESRAGDDVQVETPFGSVHVTNNQGGRPETAGMPLYPGAKPLKNRENAVVDLSSAFGDKDLHIVAGRWESSDPIDKVQKYYEDKFPDMSVIQHSGRVEMHSVNGHAKRVIVLYDRGSTTEISLASVGEPKAN